MKRLSKWRRAITEGADKLLELLCEYYKVPPIRLVINPKWLNDLGVAVHGAYFPRYHMLILRTLTISEPFDMLVLEHEFKHHFAHGLQHK